MNDNLITYKDAKSPISESYRMLRTNLQYLNIDKQNKAIVVTSANKAEGKTTTLSNLAITIAQSGKKVVLVECDLRKPRIHKTFSVKNKLGITNIIVGHKSLEEVINVIEEIPNLSVMQAGPIPPNPAEVLESKAMKEMVEKLKQMYDIVLFDAPPVCSVTDAAILSTITDGVILVVSSGGANIDATKLAKGLLDKVGANILGVVLTKVDTSKTGAYYYYYDDYYAESDNKKKRRKK